MAPITFLSVIISSRGSPALVGRGPPDVVVRLGGELDLSTVAELSLTIGRAATLGVADLVVDLSRVEFMDASTIGVLTRARDLLGAENRSLLIRSPSTCARHVLDLCELSDLIEPRPADAPPAEATRARSA